MRTIEESSRLVKSGERAGRVLLRIFGILLLGKLMGEIVGRYPDKFRTGKL